MRHGEYYVEQATVEIRIGFTEEAKSFSELTTKATGFYARNTGITHLVTNWHVVTGKHFLTQKELLNGDTPKYLMVREWATSHEYRVPLHDAKGNPTWREMSHKTTFEGKPATFDVVSIPSVTSVHAIEIKAQLLPQYQQLEPHSAVIVVGYPIERDKPIWKTAHVAESVQPNSAYYLVNGRTKSGMSGSGVFSTAIKDIRGHLLQGIYSGRIQDYGLMDRLNDLDLGIVWKPFCLAELLP